MNRPPFEVADVVRAQGDRFIENLPKLPSLFRVVPVYFCHVPAPDSHVCRGENNIQTP